MATISKLVPTALEGLVNLTGTIDDVDNGIATTGTWLTEGDDGTNTVARVEFPTPLDPPTTGAGLQKFQIWCRRSTTAGGNDPTLDVALYENDVEVSVLQTGISITSTTGELVEVTWDATLLGTTDGSAVELQVTGQRSGGSPTSRRTVEFDEFEWEVDTPSQYPVNPDADLGTFSADATVSVVPVAVPSPITGNREFTFSADATVAKVAVRELTVLTIVGDMNPDLGIITGTATTSITGGSSYPITGNRTFTFASAGTFAIVGVQVSPVVSDADLGTFSADATVTKVAVRELTILTIVNDMNPDLGEVSATATTAKVGGGSYPITGNRTFVFASAGTFSIVGVQVSPVASDADLGAVSATATVTKVAVRELTILTIVGDMNPDLGIITGTATTAKVGGGVYPITGTREFTFSSTGTVTKVPVAPPVAVSPDADLGTFSATATVSIVAVRELTILTIVGDMNPDLGIITGTATVANTSSGEYPIAGTHEFTFSSAGTVTKVPVAVPSPITADADLGTFSAAATVSIVGVRELTVLTIVGDLNPDLGIITGTATVANTSSGEYPITGNRTFVFASAGTFAIVGVQVSPIVSDADLGTFSATGSVTKVGVGTIPISTDTADLGTLSATATVTKVAVRELTVLTIVGDLNPDLGIITGTATTSIVGGGVYPITGTREFTFSSTGTVTTVPVATPTPVVADANLGSFDSLVTVAVTIDITASNADLGTLTGSANIRVGADYTTFEFFPALPFDCN